jgi:uncharacterized protein YndB with AHSA1/START domain/DNA-binding transcriptional ArsR family regulator
MQAITCIMGYVAGDLDLVFKALADPSRRSLLDSLRRRNGQTLGELCAQLTMARQSATQHLAILADANLISTVRRGRQKLHYLNPVPIHEIQRRWIAPFELPLLGTLDAIKERAEEHDMTTEQPSYVYVTYIHATPERVWHALTDADLTGAYWGHRNVSDWQPGSRWEHQRVDGSGIADTVGTVLEATPPTRLVMTFANPGEPEPEQPATVTFTVEPYQEIVRLTVTHENLGGPDDLAAVAAGWPAVFANLKSLLETGKVLPQAPWEMHAGLRERQLARNKAS